MENLGLPFVVFLGLLLFGFTFLRNPKRYTLFFIALLPVVNVFWRIKILGYSVVEFFSVSFPLLFVVIFFQRLGRGYKVTGRFNKYFVIVLATYSITLVKMFIEGKPPLEIIDPMIKVMCGFASYNLFHFLFQPQDKDRLVTYIMASLSFTILLFIFELFISPQAVWGEEGYKRGIYHDPGNYSRMALIGIILTLPILRKRTRWMPVAQKYGVISMSVVMLGYAISRNVILSAMGVLLFYAVMTRRILVVFLVIIIGISIYSYSKRVQTAYTSKMEYEMEYLEGRKVETDTLGSGRIRIWKGAWKEFKKANVFDEIFGIGRGIGPHGQFFDLLRRLGLAGLFAHLFLYLAVLFYCWKMLRQRKESNTSIYAFLLALSVMILAFAANPFYNYYYQIVLFAFLALLEKEESYEAEQEYLFRLAVNSGGDKMRSPNHARG